MAGRRQAPRTRGRTVWAKGRVWPVPRAERPVPRRGAARGGQRLRQLRRAVGLQGQDVWPAAGHLPGHRGQNPGRGPQPGHGLLGEPPAAAPRPHGTGQVSTARSCRDRGPGWGSGGPAPSSICPCLPRVRRHHAGPEATRLLPTPHPLCTNSLGVWPLCVNTALVCREQGVSAFNPPCPPPGSCSAPAWWLPGHTRPCCGAPPLPALEGFPDPAPGRVCDLSPIFSLLKRGPQPPPLRGHRPVQPPAPSVLRSREREDTAWAGAACRSPWLPGSLP